TAATPGGTRPPRTARWGEVRALRHPGDGTLGRVRHGAGVQDRRDRLNTVDEAGAGADDEAVAVDRPHGRVRELRGYRSGLLCRAVEMEPARADDDDVGRGVGELLPGGLRRPGAG